MALEDLLFNNNYNLSLRGQPGPTFDYPLLNSPLHYQYSNLGNPNVPPFANGNVVTNRPPNSKLDALDTQRPTAPNARYTPNNTYKDNPPLGAFL